MIKLHVNLNSTLRAAALSRFHWTFNKVLISRFTWKYRGKKVSKHWMTYIYVSHYGHAVHFQNHLSLCAQPFHAAVKNCSCETNKANALSSSFFFFFKWSTTSELELNRPSFLMSPCSVPPHSFCHHSCVFCDESDSVFFVSCVGPQLHYIPEGCTSLKCKSYS